MIDLNAFKKYEIVYKPTSLRAENKLAEELTRCGYNVQENRYFEKYPMSVVYGSSGDRGIGLYGTEIDSVYYNKSKIVLYNYNDYIVNLFP